MRHLAGVITVGKVTYARVAELVDALDLGSSVLRREGSTPSSRTTHVNALHYWGALIFCTYLHFFRRLR